jgi:hypothetical protein
MKGTDFTIPWTPPKTDEQLYIEAQMLVLEAEIDVAYDEGDWAQAAELEGQMYVLRAEMASLPGWD